MMRTTKCAHSLPKFRASVTPCKNLMKIILDSNFILVGYVPHRPKTLSEAPLLKAKKFWAPFPHVNIHGGLMISYDILYMVQYSTVSSCLPASMQFQSEFPFADDDSSPFVKVEGGAWLRFSSLPALRDFPGLTLTLAPMGKGSCRDING
jgi:hypothetical protein